MSKFKITIPLETDADPSELLDLALEFAKFVEDQLSEEATVDEETVSVEEVNEAL